jgi:hypothetical protein
MVAFTLVDFGADAFAAGTTMSRPAATKDTGRIRVRNFGAGTVTPSVVLSGQ